MRRRDAIGALSKGMALSAAALLASSSAQASEAVQLASVGQQALPGSTEPARIGMTTASGESFLSRQLSKVDLYWTGQLNGPSLGKQLGTNYNAFQQNYGPLYVYHTLDTIFRTSVNGGVGLELSAKQDFDKVVMGKDGYPVEPAFTFNDPQLWYRHNGILDNDWIKVDGQLSVFPGLTDYSRDSDHMVFSTALDGTYHVKLRDYRWNLYFTTRVRPTVYSLAGPFAGWKHEKLFLSAGHFLGYRLSDRFELTTSSAIDCNYFSDGSASFIRGDGYDDRAQLQLNYYPSGAPVRIGAYAQALISQPELGTSTVGVELSVSFLTSRAPAPEPVAGAALARYPVTTD